MKGQKDAKVDRRTVLRALGAGAGVATATGALSVPRKGRQRDQR